MIEILGHNDKPYEAFYLLNRSDSLSLLKKIKNSGDIALDATIYN